ncbi:PREDICTED: F-box/kelch-repeat protein At3g61590-like [Nelumbo nucifera]|uniref:F-box/kelch-repeat protein At3g61590-like n=2 Tax=Nelumbo nucifera TaxID=4432 RepID=A0A1U7ZYR9_NELNU|nr:PREDICTED: F-box/kelch-repeat protein At3g61590-like [Nelumbo nucifera]DAD27108.1 TPA_asm: hypothetical protein HUJ06_028576 [Nelumbo nucifera]
MWNNLPLDLLARVFSFLSPDSLARATAACKHWRACARTFSSYTVSVETDCCCHPPWFLAMHTRNHRGFSFYVHNPSFDRWHLLPLDFLPDPIRPVAPIGSLLLYRPAVSSPLQLGLCNLFTRHYRVLPSLTTPRTNPAVGVVGVDKTRDDASPSSFRVYVAGGMSTTPRRGTTYEATLEMYDSRVDKWQSLGWMPIEFAVRLTVWTPNESVYSDGVLYWMTSARAYSVMGFQVSTGLWKEVKVPKADQLEFASLVRRKGRLALVGGDCMGEACIWELGVGDQWMLLEMVPVELGMRFLGGKRNWCSTKCVGIDEAVYLYRDLGSEMLVWREVAVKGRWEWDWIEGCGSIRGEEVPKFPIKGMLLQPSLNPSYILDH